jgi:ATP/maltotriose-dependent transcriptional regulator MalT
LTVAQVTPWLIDRGDLLAAVDRAAARKVTVISAPAGSGKTSLLRAWAGRQGRRRRLAVVQVQRDQQDAQQFWLALLAAVRRASPGAGRAEPPAATPGFKRFVAEFSGSHRTVAEYLIAEMLDRQPPGVQDLLLRTCLLDRVNGELADVLTGRPGSPGN